MYAWILSMNTAPRISTNLSQVMNCIACLEDLDLWQWAANIHDGSSTPGGKVIIWYVTSYPAINSLSLDGHGQAGKRADEYWNFADKA